MEQNTITKFINPLDKKNSQYENYFLNDVGAGYLFADTFKNKLRYVIEAKAWYHYDGIKWSKDDGSIIARDCAKELYKYLFSLSKDNAHNEQFIKFLERLEKSNGRKVMLEEAQSVHPIRMGQFDSNPYLLNCLNVTIDLLTLEARPHNPDDLLSKVANVEYKREAKSDRWISFVNEVFENDAELARHFQKIMGYCISGDTSQECFFILYGFRTRNGKGTAMETMIFLLGDYAVTVQPESFAAKRTPDGSKPAPDLARLAGKRLANASELSETMSFNSALVKQITGNDTVTARFLHRNLFEYKPQFKLVINSNHLPQVNDDTLFASGRVRIIPFNRHFTDAEQDKDLKNTLRSNENTSGILNWLLDGFKIMQEEGIPIENEPESAKKALMEYKDSMDTVGQFLNSCMKRTDSSSMIKAKDVYARYKSWAKDNLSVIESHRKLVSILRKKNLIKRDRTSGNVVIGYEFIE